MQHIEVSRTTVVLSGVFLITLVGGGWTWLPHEAYQTIINTVSKVQFIDINVYGLVVLVAGTGLLLYLVIAFHSKKKASSVWGNKVQRYINIALCVFAIFSVFTAIAAYSWLSNSLDNSGYTYCKPLSRHSAMGRHEVYITSPELCVKHSGE